MQSQITVLCFCTATAYIWFVYIPLFAPLLTSDARMEKGERPNTQQNKEVRYHCSLSVYFCSLSVASAALSPDQLLCDTSADKQEACTFSNPHLHRLKDLLEPMYESKRLDGPSLYM